MERLTAAKPEAGAVYRGSGAGGGWSDGGVGRKECAKPWPSRTPVRYEGSWTAAEQLYLKDYLRSGTREQVSASKYTLLEGVAVPSARCSTPDRAGVLAPSRHELGRFPGPWLVQLPIGLPFSSSAS